MIDNLNNNFVSSNSLGLIIKHLIYENELLSKRVVKYILKFVDKK